MAQNVFEKINNSDLSTMSSAELQELFNEAGKTGIQGKMTKAQFNAAMRKVSDAIETAKAKENGQPQPQAAADEPKATEEEKEKFAATTDALNGMKYEPDADHRKMLNHLLIETEDGKGVRLQDELIETAKLRVLTDNAEAEQPLDKEAYKTAVDKEIETIIGSMFMASANNNEEVPDQAEKWKDLIEQQQSVSSKVASGVLASHLIDSKAKADKLAAKYENKNFLAGFTSRLNKVTDSCTKKMGKFFKQTWETAKVMYKQGTLKESLIMAGCAAGSILAAGTVVGTPFAVGLAVYSGKIAWRRTRPVVDTWHKEKETNGKDYKFKDFYKAHKGDVWKAGLYATTGFLGVVSGVVGAVAPLCHLSSNMADTAVILNGIKGTTMTARLAATPVLTTTPYVIDYFNAETKEDKKKALRNITLAGGASFASLGIAAFGADLIGDANASETVPTATEAQSAGDASSTWGGNEGNSDWRHPWGENSGVGDAPATDANAGSAEVADANADGAENAAYVHQFETRVPTDAEQAFYVKRLSLVPNSDILVANVNDGLVHIPEGMTAEQAVHTAAMQYFYYNDDTALKVLMNCDTVQNINSEELFHDLHGKFVTDINDPRPMGLPLEEMNYTNNTSRITGLDCDKVTKIVHINGKAVEVPLTEIDKPIPGVIIPEKVNIIPDPDLTINSHFQSGLDVLPQNGPAPVPPADMPDVKFNDAHFTDELDMYDQLGGNHTLDKPLEKPTTLTDAQIARILMGGKTK